MRKAKSKPGVELQKTDYTGQQNCHGFNEEFPTAFACVQVVTEVRRQLRDSPGILDGHEDPDYEVDCCSYRISICAQGNESNRCTCGTIRVGIAKSLANLLTVK